MPPLPPSPPPVESVLELIGRTPMVRIRRLNPNPRVTLFAKLEGFNPTGSIKDRIALKMIEQAEREGTLGPGKTIIEPTSGNTGIGIAMIGAVKGYPDQISNHYNQLAHYDGTAVEILEQTGGEVDYFVSSLGTSGTLMGVGLALKQRAPGVRIVSAHPVRGHYIQGLKNLEEAIVPGIYDAAKI